MWNPNTGKIIPQYHVVLDGDFFTVMYMEAGTLPPNWEDLIKYLSEMATSNDVNLAGTWLNGQYAVDAMDQISDPFAIVTDHTKHRKTDTRGYSSMSSNIHTSDSEGDNSPGNSSPPSQHNKMNDVAANSFASIGNLFSNVTRAVVHTNNFDSNPTFASKTHNSEV